MTHSTTRDYLAQHPRLIGFLFAMSMVLAEAGNVAANSTGANPGP